MFRAPSLLCSRPQAGLLFRSPISRAPLKLKPGFALRHLTSNPAPPTPPTQGERNRRLAAYALAVVVGTIGLGWAAVPLYRQFCAITGYGGVTQTADMDMLEELIKYKQSPEYDASKMREVTINFTANTNMQWDFQPAQDKIKVRVGEPALAFFVARNKLPRAVSGVATYNVMPYKAGLYFNKIQCFCFDEQRLKPQAEVDMPVWFFIDPKFEDDPRMRHVRDITLSYTFWESTDDEDDFDAADDDGEPQVCPMPLMPLSPPAAPASSPSPPSSSA